MTAKLDDKADRLLVLTDDEDEDYYKYRGMSSKFMVPISHNDSLGQYGMGISPYGPGSAGEALIMSTVDQVLNSAPSSVVRDSKIRRCSIT